MLSKLARKNAMMKNLMNRLEDQEAVEKENKRLTEGLNSTMELLTKCQKDLQDIHTEAGQQVSKLKRENAILQESQEKDQETIIRFKEVQKQFTEEMVKLKKEKDQEEEKNKEMSIKLEETKQEFTQEMLKMKEEKDQEMMTKQKETENILSEIKSKQEEMEKIFAVRMAKIKEENYPSLKMFTKIGFTEQSRSHVFKEVTLEWRADLDWLQKEVPWQLETYSHM